jgi:hypothetical protein
VTPVTRRGRTSDLTPLDSKSAAAGRVGRTIATGFSFEEARPMVEFQPFGPKVPHDPEGTLEHERDVREEAERAHHMKRASETAHRSSLGYAIVLLGAALFMAACFLPYYGYEFARGGSVSPYDQLIVAYGGGLQLGSKLFLFGGVATVVVVALIGLIRRGRPSWRGFLAGAVTAWSLTWIGSLLQSASLYGGGSIRGLSLEVGFLLQAVSIGVVIIGTILLVPRRRGAHEHGAPSIAAKAGPDTGREDDRSTA